MQNAELYFSFFQMIPGLRLDSSSIAFSATPSYREIWASPDIETAIGSYGYSDGVFKGIPERLSNTFKGHGLPIVLPSGGMIWCGAVRDDMAPCLEIKSISRVSDDIVFGQNAHQILAALRRFRSFFTQRESNATAKTEYRAQLNKSIKYYYDRVDVRMEGRRTPVKDILDSMFGGKISYYFEHPWDDQRRKASFRWWLNPNAFLSSWKVAAQAAAQSKMQNRFWWLGTYSPGLAALAVRHLIPVNDFHEVYAGLEPLIPSDFGWNR